MDNNEIRSEIGIQIMSPQRLQKPHQLRIEDMPNANHYYNLAKLKSQSTPSKTPFWIIWLIVSILVGLLIK